MKLCIILDKVLSGKAKEMILDLKGVLRVIGWICVPKVGNLTRLIMEEAHSLRYFMYPGSVRMYHDLKKSY